VTNRWSFVRVHLCSCRSARHGRLEGTVEYTTTNTNPRKRNGQP